MHPVLKKYSLAFIGFGFKMVSYVSPAFALKQAIDLFSRPRKGRITESYQKKFLNQAHHLDVDIEGNVLSFYIFGKGPKSVLLAHGWESNTWRWRKLMKYFGTEYQFISIDAPGHGTSLQKKFDLLLYSKAIQYAIVEYKPSAVIGHSMGGLAVMHALSKSKSTQNTALAILASPHSLQYILGLYFKALSMDKRFNPLLKKYFYAAYKVELDEVAVPAFGHLIPCKSIIIHDQDDQLNHVSCSEINCSSLPHAQLIITQGLTHSLQHESVFLKVKNFIETHQGA